MTQSGRAGCQRRAEEGLITLLLSVHLPLVRMLSPCLQATAPLRVAKAGAQTEIDGCLADLESLCMLARDPDQPVTKDEDPGMRITSLPRLGWTQAMVIRG